ncbi:MAG: hypothetical protein Q7S06_01140 [Nanoarchaeota archaeon]|nr:hypothetical protein [Nanoarchaeota archaeon]
MKHNKSKIIGERHLKKYIQTMILSARHTDTVLEKWEPLMQSYFGQKKLEELCTSAGGLLHQLGIYASKSDEQLEKELGGNGENTVHLVLCLRYLQRGGYIPGKTTESLNAEEITGLYKEIMGYEVDDKKVEGHLQKVRAELRSIYQDNPIK